jgi:sortase B
MENKKRATGLLSNLLLLICVVVFCFSAYKLVGYLTEYKKGEQEYSDLAESVTVEDTDNTEQTEENKENPPKVDFEKLLKINPEVVGWIVIEDTVINYPIVQGSDNEYYLHRTFENNVNQGGSIFLDADNQPDFTSDNSLVYGHNLKTGKMFGSLRYYTDKDYWKKHPYIWILTKDRSMKYQIFASSRVTTADSVYTLEFGSREDFSDYLTHCKEIADYDTGVEVTPDDLILTLSTCTSDTEDGRRVVQAKKIYDEVNDNEQVQESEGK